MPRYTSYPTVPFWNDEIDRAGWENACRTQFDKENHTNGISLYIHLPFCESLCTYCGCNKKITKNHGVENEYLLAIEKEWNLYRKLMNQTPIVREVHLGGGTPTFFSPSIVVSDSSILNTSCGTYESKMGIAHFPCRSSILNKEQYIEADTLDYNKTSGFGKAIGNVIAIGLSVFL